MWLFHFRSIVKMPSFYSVFCLGCQRHFIGCPFGTSRKKHQPFPVAQPDFFIQFIFIYYLILLVAASCRNELLLRSLPTRRKSWEGKGTLSGERFLLFFHSPTSPFPKTFAFIESLFYGFTGCCQVSAVSSFWKDVFEIFSPVIGCGCFTSAVWWKCRRFILFFVWYARGILLVVPLELQERNISHFLWHTGFFIQLVSFIILSCWWLLPAGTNSFRAASPPDESLGRGKEPFLEKDFSFPSTAPPLLFQRLSRLSNPCTMVLRDAAKRPLYRPSEKTRLKFLTLS